MGNDLIQRRFAFRANGNKDIGWGHVVRTLSLADRFVGPSFFVTNNNAAILERIRNAGHAQVTVPFLKDADFQWMVDALEAYPERFSGGAPSEEEELEFLIPIFKKEKIYGIVTDLLAPSRAYIQTLHDAGFFVVCLDEFNGHDWPADLIFHNNPNAQKYMSEQKNIFHGADYTLLRKNFRTRPQKIISKELQRILITCGGTDMKGLSLKALQVLIKKEYQKLQITLVIGPDFKFRNDLETLLSQCPQIQIQENVRDMIPLMSATDLAITSGGTTMYELAACGVPSLVLAQYEHQNEFASAMAATGAVLNLGLGEKITEEKMAEALFAMRSFEKRSAMSLSGQQTIDGRGVERVSQVIQRSFH